MRLRFSFLTLPTILYLACLLSLTACQGWKDGGVEGWKSGGLEDWKGGRLEDWTPPAIGQAAGRLDEGISSNKAGTSPIPPTSNPPILQSSNPFILLGLVGWPGSLNPLNDTAPVLRELSPLLYNSLLIADPVTAELRPGLARRWEYSADGQQVTFHLPAGLKWSDGKSLTAADLVDSLRATRHPALAAFQSLAAPDDETLVLTFAQVDCAAVSNLALLPLLPAADVLAQQPHGSGPFRVVDWADQGRSLTLERNPYYAGSRSRLAGMTIRFITAAEAAVALSEGQFDALGPLPALAYRDITKGSSPAGLTDLAYPAPQLTYLAMNYAPVNSPRLDSSIRQALALALDRPALLDELLAGDGQLLAGPLLPQHWAAQPDLAQPAYNPQLARAMLAWAGLKDTNGDGWLERDGQRLELSIRLNGDNPLHQRLGWLVSSYYRDLGLFVQAEGVPFPSVVDDLFTHDFSLALFSWLTPADPDQRFYWRSTENTEGQGLNFVSYKSRHADDLLDEAAAVPGCAPQARAKLYAGVQRLLVTDHPVDFLLASNLHVLVASRLDGLQPGPFAGFTWNAAEWSLQEN